VLQWALVCCRDCVAVYCSVCCSACCSVSTISPMEANKCIAVGSGVL